MKPLVLSLIALLPIASLGHEEMTPERFRELVVTAGDTNALRPELASLPFWTNAQCSVTMKYQDGKVFKETCRQTAKTVQGKFIVFSMDSKYYQQTMHSIAGFDEKAKAVRVWGLYGETLTEATTIFDFEKKLTASTATYGEGFTEISVGSYSDQEMTDHAVAYKNGVLFMTRDVKSRPMPRADKPEAAAAQPAAKPAERQKIAE